jgi:chromosomal replication initiation ATPase DnaA
MEIELLANPTNIKLAYDPKEDRTLVSYDSAKTAHDGCYYSVLGNMECEEIEGNILKLREVTLDVEETIEQFSVIAGVTSDDFKGKCREVRITIARQCYMKFLVKNTRMSLSAIGRSINRDHATVINGIKHIDGLIETKDTLIEPYKALLL